MINIIIIIIAIFAIIIIIIFIIIIRAAELKFCMKAAELSTVTCICQVSSASLPPPTILLYPSNYNRYHHQQ